MAEEHDEYDIRILSCRKVFLMMNLLLFEIRLCTVLSKLNQIKMMIEMFYFHIFLRSRCLFDIVNKSFKRLNSASDIFLSSLASD